MSGKQKLVRKAIKTQIEIVEPKRTVVKDEPKPKKTRTKKKTNV